MTTDLPDRLQLQRALAESERLFHVMADAAPVLLWMSGRDARGTFFNHTWLKFTGRRLEDVLGHGWEDDVHPDDRRACLDAYRAAAEVRGEFEVEYRLRRADGDYRWVLARGAPRLAEDGTFEGYIGSCIDITERRVMEQAMRDAMMIKDEFLGMVSHELRTPLTVLQILVERFRTEIAINPGQRDLAERMNVATQRLTRLVDTMLEYTRIESGRSPIELVELDLAPVITAAVEDVRPAADRKGLALRASIPELPPVCGDATTIELILSNLLHNAIKFTDRGSIEVVASHGAEGHRVEVIDTGRGIDPALHGRVFEPFEQLEPSRQKHTPGVGLGLALVKALAGQLGGRIELRSALGEGSTFALVFPGG